MWVRQGTRRRGKGISSSIRDVKGFADVETKSGEFHSPISFSMKWQARLSTANE